MEKIEIPKKESGISRIITAPENEAVILECFKRLFKESVAGPFEEFLKPPELVQSFKEINGFMKIFIKKYGGRALDLKPEHLHLVNISKLEPHQMEFLNKHRTYGRYSAQRQVIFIFLEDLNIPKLKLAEAVAHEMLHFQAFYSFDLDGDGDQQPDSTIAPGDIELRSTPEDGSSQTLVLRRRRAGLAISSAAKRKDYFRKTDEAVISELTKRFARRYFFQIKYLAEELREKERLIKQSRSAEESPLQKGEVSYIDADQNTYEFAYPQERERLRDIIEDLYKKNKSTFTTKEVIFEMFARASITGRFLSLARLFEKTYGPGTFKKWAEEEAEDRK